MQLANNTTDLIATACPLCKKTLAAAQNDVPVQDISEIMVKALKDNRKVNLSELKAKMSNPKLEAVEEYK